MAKTTDLAEVTTLADGDLGNAVDVSNTSMDATGTNSKFTMANLWAYIKTKADTYYAPVLGADDNYVTDAEKIVIGNTSGTNTGDQTITNSSDATSHTVTLSASGGSVQFIEGSNITLTTGGTGSAGTVIIAATGASGATTALDNLASVAINTTLVSDTDNTDDLGTTLKKWANLFVTTIGATATRVTKGWFTDIEITNMPTVGGTAILSSLTAPQFTTIELGHATDTTLSRVSAGVLAVEGVNLLRTSDVDDTPVNGATTDPVSSNWAFDHAALASSDTVVGHVELAIASEVNTGTSTSLAVSPDGLAGSYAGTKSISIQCFDGGTDVTTGDGKAYITIPEALNGMNLIRAQATVVTAGTTNATTVMVHNKTDAQDMLSGAISIASGGTVGTVGTINTTYDDVATNDVLRIDVDSVSTTAPKGLVVVLEFRLA